MPPLFKYQYDYLRYLKKKNPLYQPVVITSSDYVIVVKEKTLDCSNNVIN